jgi:hypothetical protein
VLLLAAAGAASSNSPVGVAVQIDAGVTPRLSGAAVVTLVQDHVADMVAAGAPNTTPLKISGAHAVKGSSLATAISDGPALEGAEADQTYWIVAGTGTFVARRGLGPDKVFSSGFYIIDDATGDFVGMGMP